MSGNHSADYGNYTTYHFDDVDEMSDYESTAPPPPPPPPLPSHGGSKNNDEEEGDIENLHNDNEIPAIDGVPKDLKDNSDDKDKEQYDDDGYGYGYGGLLNRTRTTEDDDAEDNSVEIPPTQVVEDMMRKERQAATGKRTSRTLMMAGVACLLVSLAAILGAGFGTGAFDMSSSGSSESASASAAEGYEPNPIPGDPIEEGGSSGGGGEVRPEEPSEVSDSARGLAMREYLSGVSEGGANSFADLSSPESLALQWLVLEDPLQLDASEETHHFRIVQRYALMTLWYNSDFTWANETNWMNDDECSWYGVGCMGLNAGAQDGTETTVVTTLDLQGNNVQGNIPADLALLEFLTSLNLADNVMEGALPSSLSKLVSLQELYLDRNLFGMDLSTFDFAPLTQLALLDLAANQFFGGIPDSIWQLTNIELLVLDNNQLTGSISGEIANLSNMGK